MRGVAYGGGGARVVDEDAPARKISFGTEPGDRHRSSGTFALLDALPARGANGLWPHLSGQEKNQFQHGLCGPSRRHQGSARRYLAWTYVSGPDPSFPYREQFLISSSANAAARFSLGSRHIDYRGFMRKLMIDFPEHRCLTLLDCT